ncbi:MAG: GrpB family protein [Mycobacteriales bacterium]
MHGEERLWAYAEEPVSVLPYDPSWPIRFQEEQSLLLAAISSFTPGGVHHVGSTAVPGLAAKPIIDILAGVADLDASRPCIELLAPLGYRHAPYRTDEMHWFCKPDPSRRTHHLHLVPDQSPRFRSELRFRDHLRAHPETAVAYARLKYELAERFRLDREAYTEAKGDFVRDVLQRAS